MAVKAADAMAEALKAHEAADVEEATRLRSLSLRERSALIESACEAAAVICRSRLAAGLPDVQPAPWPASTWDFLRRHAARVRS
jgi:hypothetical protein